MTFEKIVYDPVFGNNEVKIWATSKQSFNKYYTKAKELFNLLMHPDLDISLSPVDHIEIIRSNIKFYFCLNVTETTLDYQFAGHRIICIRNVISIT